MNAHSKAPWKMSGSAILSAGDAIEQCVVAVVSYPGMIAPASIAERHANGRLIEAAPDLLAALQACYDMIAEECGDGEYTHQAEQARAAIAKATGAA